MATKLQEGSVIWLKVSPGAGEYSLTVDSLASGAARQSAKVDIGANFADKWRVDVLIDTSGTAPGAGETADVYAAPSGSATAASENPAGTTGSDAAYSGYSGGSLDDSLKQLDFIGSLSFDDVIDINQQTSMLWYPTSRYNNFVVDNNTAQAFGTGCTIKLTELKVVSD